MSASEDRRKVIFGLLLITGIAVCYVSGIMMIFESGLDPTHAGHQVGPGVRMSICGILLSVITLIYLR